MSEEEEMKPIQRQHDELCDALTVDDAARKSSWESYNTVNENYMLEGEPMHWLACALYVACRTSVTQTVKKGSVVEGNCVSLTKLLRLSNISLIQFFNKIKMWMGMVSMSEEFALRIEQLERKFAVSVCLFRKYQPIFYDLFQARNNEASKPVSKNTKKHKLTLCTTNSLFEFTWCLFISVKGEFHSSAHDLVDMYHLLLSCLDFVFANTYMAQRTDLINPKFVGLPADWGTEDAAAPTQPLCIIEHMCKSHKGLFLEASTTKQYSWKPVIQSFFTKNILKGDKSNLTGVLDILNFECNLKALNNLYETYVLSVGEFDERIFFGVHANTDVGAVSNTNGDEFTNVIAQFGTQSGKSHAPDTPLTGRGYLRTQPEMLTPVSAATQSLTRLQAYLSGAKPQPSSRLYQLFNESGVSEQTVQACAVEPCRGWAQRLVAALRGATKASAETAAARVNIITTLHFKTLERILREERRKKPHASLQMLVSQEIFQCSLYACCAEVVLHAYGSHSTRFPWVLQSLQLSAFHFYKIIELAVQTVMDKLSRDIIKHLNSVEERALESLVWASDSPLWALLDGCEVPASAEVAAASELPSPAPVRTTPGVNRRRLHTNSGSGGLGSPVSSVSDRFLSPNADQARKQLFQDDPVDIKPGQSLLVQSGNSVIMSNGTAAANNVATESSQETMPTTPVAAEKKKNSSVNLFFRKFYSLAVVRMNDMCARLNLNDEKLRGKIWTCLEHCIMQQTHLLRDRHLDQILMCSIYVICRVVSTATSTVERSFTAIMRHYREQPQADNHVYRHVLIHTATPERPADHGDLIRFYNEVYVKHVQNFAWRFSKRDECCLSPLPAGRGGALASPAGQRVSERHQLFVKPLSSPSPADTQLTYRFSRSPAKDLRAINTLLSCGASMQGVKRSAEAWLEREGKRPAPGVARKLQGLITDRQAV